MKSNWCLEEHKIIDDDVLCMAWVDLNRVQLMIAGYSPSNILSSYFYHQNDVTALQKIQPGQQPPRAPPLFTVHYSTFHFVLFKCALRIFNSLPKLAQTNNVGGLIVMLSRQQSRPWTDDHFVSGGRCWSSYTMLHALFCIIYKNRATLCIRDIYRMRLPFPFLWPRLVVGSVGNTFPATSHSLWSFSASSVSSLPGPSGKMERQCQPLPWYCFFTYWVWGEILRWKPLGWSWPRIKVQQKTRVRFPIHAVQSRRLTALLVTYILVGQTVGWFIGWRKLICTRLHRYGVPRYAEV